MSPCASISLHFTNLFPRFDEWYESKYQVDEQDHSGRFICLIDITSQLFHLVKGILSIAIDLLKGVGAFLGMIFVLPFTCCSTTAKALKKELVPYLTDNLYSPIKNNDRLFFFFISIPKIIIKIVGNAIGILFPEAGRLGRRMESTTLPFDQRRMIPTFKEWKNSTYAIDKEDHTGRLICIADIFSQVWQLISSIYEVVKPIIIGLFALIFSIILVPTEKVTSLCGMKHVTKVKDEVVSAMMENLSMAPCNVLIFIMFVIPQIILKICGNTIGILIPEVGRWFRRWEKLKINGSS